MKTKLSINFPLVSFSILSNFFSNFTGFLEKTVLLFRYLSFGMGLKMLIHILVCKFHSKQVFAATIAAWTIVLGASADLHSLELRYKEHCN